MAKSANVIRIPRPPASAFNKHRPVSELIWSQVEHLAAVVKKDIDDQSRARKKDIDDQRRAISTEGQASDFIRKMTAILHSEAAGNRPAPSPSGAKKKPPRSSKK